MSVRQFVIDILFLKKKRKKESTRKKKKKTQTQVICESCNNFIIASIEHNPSNVPNSQKAVASL